MLFFVHVGDDIFQRGEICHRSNFIYYILYMSYVVHVCMSLYIPICMYAYIGYLVIMRQGQMSYRSVHYQSLSYCGLYGNLAECNPVTWCPNCTKHVGHLGSLHSPCLLCRIHQLTLSLSIIHVLQYRFGIYINYRYVDSFVLLNISEIIGLKCTCLGSCIWLSFALVMVLFDPVS